MFTKVINSNDLTADCWMIQFKGLEACKECEFKDTPDCGGQKIRQDLMTKGSHGKVTLTGLPDQRGQSND